MNLEYQHPLFTEEQGFPLHCFWKLALSLVTSFNGHFVSTMHAKFSYIQWLNDVITTLFCKAQLETLD